MKRISCAICVIIPLLMFNPFSYAFLLNDKGDDISDGGFHLYDGSFHTIQVDFETPGAGTTVETNAGVSGAWIHAYEDSIINIKGGVFSTDSWAMDRCQFNLSGGILEGLHTHDYSMVTISGGQVNRLYQAIGNSTVNISGGSLTGGAFIQNNSIATVSGGNLDHLTVADYSQTTVSGGVFGNLIQAGSYWDKGYGHHSNIIFEGSYFAINGVAVNNGDSARMYTTQDLSWKSTGILTGILANGDTINTTIEIIDEADMIFVVPEPATASLLALGFLLRRRKK